MRKSAVRVTVIVYGLLLALMYVAGNPPGWMDAIAISTERVGVGTFLGHRFEVRLVVERPAVRPLPRMVRAIDLRTGSPAADLVCAPVPASLHRIGGR